MYKLTNTETILRISDNAGIPPDPANRDYAEYLLWLNGWTEEIRSPYVWSEPVPEVPATYDEQHNELTPMIPAVPPEIISGGEVIETIVHEPHTPEPYVPPPTPIPTAITMRQARLALLNAGLLSQVNAAVAASTEQAKIEWEFSNEVQRTNPLIAVLSAGLGLSSEQVDELFITGSVL